MMPTPKLIDHRCRIGVWCVVVTKPGHRFPKLRNRSDLWTLAFLMVGLVLLVGNWSVLPDFHHRHVKPHIDPALDHPSLTSLILEPLRRNTPTHAR
jgi:hypothetical protein